jgi:hypothetical protein
MRIQSAPSAADPLAPLQGNAQFSLPARCFLASLLAKHRLDLNAAANGSLVALQWRYQKALACSADAPPGRGWPRQSDVKVLLPAPGLDMSAVQSMLLSGALLPDTQHMAAIGFMLQSAREPAALVSMAASKLETHLLLVPSAHAAMKSARETSAW